MDVSAEFAPKLSSLTRVRRLVADEVARHSLEVWGPVVVANELASNALRHTGSRFEVSVRVGRDVVRIEVRDTGRRLSLPSDQPGGGFGLRIVEALSRAWGSETIEDGKLTWAEVATVPIPEPAGGDSSMAGTGTEGPSGGERP